MRFWPRLRQLLVVGTIILTIAGSWWYIMAHTYEQRYAFIEKKLDQFEERLYKEAKERI